MVKTTHQLAAELLKCENVPVTVSVDMEDTHPPGSRVFGHGLIDMQKENDGSVTLIFESGLANYQ